MEPRSYDVNALLMLATTAELEGNRAGALALLAEAHQVARGVDTVAALRAQWALLRFHTRHVGARRLQLVTA
jgi:hypothetical protein|nr:hypothetical protein [Kofleriaceae bacterium]